jgi:hypothetical protein
MPIASDPIFHLVPPPPSAPIRSQGNDHDIPLVMLGMPSEGGLPFPNLEWYREGRRTNAGISLTDALKLRSSQANTSPVLLAVGADLGRLNQISSAFQYNEQTCPIWRLEPQPTYVAMRPRGKSQYPGTIKHTPYGNELFSALTDAHDPPCVYEIDWFFESSTHYRVGYESHFASQTEAPTGSVDPVRYAAYNRLLSDLGQVKHALMLQNKVVVVRTNSWKQGRAFSNSAYTEYIFSSSPPTLLLGTWEEPTGNNPSVGADSELIEATTQEGLTESLGSPLHLHPRLKELGVSRLRRMGVYSRESANLLRELLQKRHQDYSHDPESFWRPREALLERLIIAGVVSEIGEPFDQKDSDGYPGWYRRYNPILSPFFCALFGLGAR